MLTAVPKSWFSWDFDIQDESRQSIAEVRLSNWLERGAISVPGMDCKVSRQSVLGAFVLEQEGSILARAEKPNPFLREFIIEHDAKTYTLKAWSAFRRAMVLYKDGIVVGKLVPESFLTRSIRVELPEDMPLVLGLFVIWLTLVLWQRDSGASDSNTAGADAAAGSFS
jgi:hypothetical protein